VLEDDVFFRRTDDNSVIMAKLNAEDVLAAAKACIQLQMKLLYESQPNHREVVLAKNCYRCWIKGSSRTIWCEPLDGADRAKLDAKKNKFQKLNNLGTGKKTQSSSRNQSRQAGDPY
jgi:hypothetical protein